ncbi:MAG: protein TolR [Deltaproteobacteria bacterium]|nr:protein TolR [Deltaproteobacteria bacterium]MBT6435635.1 protein TolR [Deltaproteobacteria bacterium]MBT6488383.1 protein TolR [Deltaproteobacteria bacterium]
MAIGSSSGKTMNEINVTPLVDVMLVLMIIFMVTAPLIQQGVKVDLPDAKAQAMPSDEKITVLTLTKDRKVFLGEEELAWDKLRTLLSTNKKLRTDKEVYLHADRNLPYGVVVDVMDMLKDAGVSNLGMVTDPLSKKKN